MDKKRKIKISLILMPLIVAVSMIWLVGFLGRVFMPKNPVIKRGNYYAQKEKTDVLFMGTSHAYAGFVPMELYREYGISSYCLATSGERMALTYYSLKDALLYQTPKVVVVDVHALEYGNEKNDPQVSSRCHTVFDYMKFSKIKVEAVKDIIDDPNQYIDYFFPLYFYHNRWTELTKKDFEDPRKQGYMRGSNIMSGVADPEPFTVLPSNDYTWEDNYSTEYAEKIVKMCGEKGIDVLFVCVPFPCDEKAQRDLNKAYPIAEKYDNCEYLNLLEYTDEMGFDYSIDMADSTSHVNPSGGRKVTRFIGEYIRDKYEFYEIRPEDFEENYVNFTNYYHTFRYRCNTYLEYMTMLYEPDYSYCIYIKDVEAVKNSDRARKLLIQSGQDISRLDEASKTYCCSNLSGTKEQYVDAEVEDLPECDLLSQADDAIIFVVKNNYTGQVQEVRGFSSEDKSSAAGNEDNLTE